MPVLRPDQVEEFLREHRRGVLATLKSDGRPQLSNVAFGFLDGVVRISTSAGRAKAGNARRDPRVSLHVASRDFWTYLVLEGDAQLSDVAREPGDATCRALLELYNAVSDTPHPDPDEFHQAMVAERRLQLSFHPTHRYPLAG